MDFLARQKKLRQQIAPSRLDALLVSYLPNIRYLCGFTGSAGFLLVGETGSIFFSDARYTRQAHEEAKGAKVVISRKSALTSVGEWIRARRQKKRSKGWTLGIEAEHLTL